MSLLLLLLLAIVLFIPDLSSILVINLVCFGIIAVVLLVLVILISTIAICYLHVNGHCNTGTVAPLAARA